MAYTAWSVVAGEKPTAAKWNILGDNDAAFNNGSGFDDDIILEQHIKERQVSGEKLTATAFTQFYATMENLTSSGTEDITGFGFVPTLMTCTSVRTQSELVMTNGYARNLTNGNIEQYAVAIGGDRGEWTSSNAFYHHYQGSDRMRGEVTEMSNNLLRINVTEPGSNGYGRFLIHIWGLPSELYEVWS